MQLEIEREALRKEGQASKERLTALEKEYADLKSQRDGLKSAVGIPRSMRSKTCRTPGKPSELARTEMEKSATAWRPPRVAEYKYGKSRNSKSISMSSKPGFTDKKPPALARRSHA